MARKAYCADCGVVVVDYDGEYCDGCIEEIVAYLERKEEDYTYAKQAK